MLDVSDRHDGRLRGAARIAAAGGVIASLWGLGAPASQGQTSRSGAREAAPIPAGSIQRGEAAPKSRTSPSEAKERVRIPPERVQRDVPAAQGEASRAGVRGRTRVQHQTPCVASAGSGFWSLEGTLITPDAVIPQGIITIAGNKIASVNPVKAGGPPACSMRIDGIILPGLIDLHNHLTWNVHPRWKPPTVYSNRTQWRLSPEHQNAIVLPQKDLVGSAKLGCEANLYAEVKALAGGATSAVGGLDITRDGYDTGNCITGLIRNLDYDSRFPEVAGPLSNFRRAGQSWRTPIDPCAAHTEARPILDVAVNEIFPLGARNIPDDIPPMSTQRADYLKCNLNSGRLRSLIVHLAEGTDQVSRQEFYTLQKLGLLQEGLIIIHGTALQSEEFAKIKKSGVGLVWSPRSNIELYGATLDIPAARNAGVPIAIGPDWSPTGSDGMLQELNYARANFSDFNAEQLTSMATSIPAKLARVDDRIGQLRAGLYADLLVVRRRPRSAHESVVTASPADVQLVVVDGRPVYGDSQLMHQLVPGERLALMTICGTSKAIDLSGTMAAQSSWTAVKASLQQRLVPANLVPIECSGVPASNFLRGPAPGPVSAPDIIDSPVPDPGPEPSGK